MDEDDWSNIIIIEIIIIVTIIIRIDIIVGFLSNIKNTAAVESY